MSVFISDVVGFSIEFVRPLSFFPYFIGIICKKKKEKKRYIVEAMLVTEMIMEKKCIVTY